MTGFFFNGSGETGDRRSAARSWTAPGEHTLTVSIYDLGPGDIAQAHTVGEWIDIEQLESAAGIYEKLIAQLCG